MGKAPNKCPICEETVQWKLVDTQKTGFSVGKAAAGAVLLGSVGLVGSTLGKKNNAIIAENAVLIMNIKRGMGMKKVLIIFLMGLLGLNVSACGNDEYEKTLKSGYEKYLNGDEMSQEEYNAVKSFKKWEDKQTPKTYSDWDD